MTKNTIKIVTYNYLDDALYSEVKLLRDHCLAYDNTSLKLELEYKLETSRIEHDLATPDINEFLYYKNEQLIGYIGISCFSRGELEVNGMVHPEFRRSGVFTELFQLMLKECVNRKPSKLLLLSDHNSKSGEAFLKNMHVYLEFSEYEMHLNPQKSPVYESLTLSFRKANNSDAKELARQNQIYFSDVHQEKEMILESLVMPEEEEKKGMFIYMAEFNQNIVGKVNLSVSSEIGAIYGLGVLPNHRRKGYGRQILLFSVQEFQKLGCKTIMLQVVVENQNALNLYLDCGFEVVSTMDYYVLKL